MITRYLGKLLASLVLAFSFVSAAVAAGPAKNVIVMIADGAGHNTWAAASMYQGRWDEAHRRSTQVYDQPGWVRYGCTTYPLTLSYTATRTRAQSAKLVYDPAKAWLENQIAGLAFAGYTYLKLTATDSAAAASAIASGQKTYNHAINWSNMDQPLDGATLPEIAKERGRAAGVITTVEWSHATPAGLGGAHHGQRDEYGEIANEMLEAPYLDVIMGAGHPGFDNNGKPASKSAKYVGGTETWKQLKAGTHPNGWRLIETKAAFQALAATPAARVQKTLGTAQVFTTLQQARGKFRATDTPFSAPLNAQVPTLATMAQAAINVLAAHPGGFYLMIEGGAVDWANHNNQPARMIEEQVDFVRAVEAVVAWVEKNSSWEETLVILTADHDNGLVWGPNSDKRPFDPIANNGPGKLPGMKYNCKVHANSLVPLYARGPGAQRFAELVDGTDNKAAEKWAFSGQYVDNTDIFRVVQSSMDGAQAKPARQTAPLSQ